MSDEVKTVVLDTFPNEFIAQVLVGFLKDEGIAAFVRGENLQDAAAFSERLRGNLTARVWVEEARLEEARKVLAAARAAGHLAAEEAGENDPAGEDDPS